MGNNRWLTKLIFLHFEKISFFLNVFRKNWFSWIFDFLHLYAKRLFPVRTTNEQNAKKVFFDLFDCMKQAVQHNRCRANLVSISSYVHRIWQLPSNGSFCIFHRTGREAQVSYLFAPYQIRALKQECMTELFLGGTACFSAFLNIHFFKTDFS